MGRKSKKQIEFEQALRCQNLGDALEIFAEIANETKGGSFTIYKRQRDRQWVVHLQNLIYKGFSSSVLIYAIKDACYYLLRNRKKVRGTYYTMFYERNAISSYTT